MGFPFGRRMRFLKSTIPITLPTVYSSVEVTPSGSDLIVTYVTSNPCASEIHIGTSEGLYPIVKTVAGSRTSHTITLTSEDGLVDRTTYHFVLTDSSNFSEDSTFTYEAPSSIISNVAAGVSGSTVTITWDTLDAGSTGIEWGETSAYGQAALNEGEGSTTSHSIVLDASDGLATGTYYYRVGTQVVGVWHYGPALSFTIS